ncbi:hypothetical protein [Amycolatopsis alkalitolerans]|uniref:Uncharacterized protein n=1 Tax=Amycolatopsis alkalitolerans TaxID=2547244 RepID=A0A5C4M1B3_9PSEU|nr:hypothetical protein [Amycolatopsis alkalitolerans]TNC25138.1 hypothetical protein FG385_15950 [Amycolatopsis alkalitolerans]
MRREEVGEGGEHHVGCFLGGTWPQPEITVPLFRPDGTTIPRFDSPAPEFAQVKAGDAIILPA